MDDKQIHAELERIGSTYVAWWDLLGENDESSSEEGKMLRLLAESQAALGEIVDEVAVYDDGTFTNIACESCKKILKIARNAYRGGK